MNRAICRGTYPGVDLGGGKAVAASFVDNVNGLSWPLVDCVIDLFGGLFAAGGLRKQQCKLIRSDRHGNFAIKLALTAFAIDCRVVGSLHVLIGMGVGGAALAEAFHRPRLTCGINIGKARLTK